MKSVRFHVPGKPQGKARARTFKNRYTGKSVSMTPDNTALYENFIKQQYLQSAEGTFFEAGTPVAIHMVIRFLPTKSVSKKKQAQMLEGAILPLKKPDIDNVVKVICDALNGVAYHDDTQVVVLNAKKVYSAIEGVDVTVEEYACGR